MMIALGKSVHSLPQEDGGANEGLPGGQKQQQPQRRHQGAGEGPREKPHPST